MTAASSSRFAAFGPLLAAAFGCSALVYLSSLFAPSLTLQPLPAYALAFTCVTLEILALAWFVPLRSSGYRVTVALVAASLCVLGALHGAALPASGWSAALLTFALGSSAALLGGKLGARIEQPGQLAAVALVSSIADLWSVFDPDAPSARFVERALASPEQLALFALPFPLLGTPLIAAIIGVGDVVFVALYVAAFRAHGLPVRRLVLALALAFALALVGLLVTMRPLPLLPLLGAAVIAAEPASRSLTRREWRTVLGVSAALLLMVVLLRVR